MIDAPSESARKFDPARAGEYEVQSRIALAGYDGCHELSACMLAVVLGSGHPARILVVGAGGGAQEIVTAGPLEPAWLFTAVDPSPPMMELSIDRLRQHGLLDRTETHLGFVEDLAEDQAFDAATLIGVLHHLPGDEAKEALLSSIGKRLKPNAPLILAGNRHLYATKPLLLAAWAERWRLHGATAEEVRAKQGKILHGADPPHSEEHIAALLRSAGFGEPMLFFSSLFWGAWLARRLPLGPT